MLVNLVKNAAEAMPGGGRIRLGLCESPAGTGTAPRLALTIEDNGPGIPEEALDRIFESGYTTCAKTGEAKNPGWAAAHRGLGLAITRSIVEAAGGRIRNTQGSVDLMGLLARFAGTAAGGGTSGNNGETKP